MTESAFDLADANLIQSIREHARWQEPCECVESDGVLLVAGPNDFAAGYRNCVARTDPRITVQEVIDRARDFFAARRRRFVVLVRANRDADLEAALLAVRAKLRTDAPCMLIDAPLAEVDPPPGVRVECFAEEHHVQDAMQVNAEAYQANRLPPAETKIYFGRPTALLCARVIGYVAYRGTQPLSTALTVMSGRGAGVYWVGTAATAQRMGLAGLCTRLATNAGFARGASVVTLQASPFGEPVYRRLGYKTYDRMKWYSYPATV
ncbi:MAG: GNAT family N-acetyltransferase [Sulfurifustaceae bacterium]